MTDPYTERLSDYIDGALTTSEARDVEAHLAGCDACRAAVAELRSIIADAGTLEATMPASDLWPAIAARIEAERERQLPGAGGLEAAPARNARSGMRRLSFTIPQLAAAAVVLVFASAGGAWMLTRASGPAPAIAGAPSGSVVPVSTVGATSPDTELAELEAALTGGEQQLDPTTVAVLRRNLLIIEQALVEARAALDADPANPYLSRHYENTLNKKRELLLQAGSIARGST